MKRLVTVLFLWFGTSNVQSATINVPADQPTIQAGIDLSGPGDTVLVAPSTYTETLTFPLHQVIVRSSGGADLTFLQHPGGSENQVYILDSDSGSVFEGFTISGVSVGADLILAFGAVQYFEIRNNKILDRGVGTAIRGGNGASLIVSHNLFSNAGQWAMVTLGSNCSFINNTVDGGGSGLAIYGANSIILNNIITNLDNYGINDPQATTLVNYNDFWNNNPNYRGTAVPGGNDISVDPIYNLPLSNDYTLQPTSPCIDAGDPAPQYNDPDGTRNDIGAFVYSQCNSDLDGDGVINCLDNCVQAYNPIQSDLDGDGLGDVCDDCPMDTLNDRDGDGVCGGTDNCIDVYNPSQSDSDGDGNGDVCDLCPGFDDTVDTDSDGAPDGCDICSGFNDTIDNDGDGVPDGCDKCAGFDDSLDTDGDSVPDGCDICPGFNDTIDGDGDGAPDGCDICPGFDDFADFDGDGAPDSCDNCPDHFNVSQADIDGDGIGNVCDFCMFDPGNDMDADSICAAVDNCPSDYNPGQEDTDSDGIGDACCCIGLRGDVNGDGLVEPDIVDVTFLVDFLWQGGDTPPCPNGADVNGQDGADIVDVTFLVDFLWQGGPQPPACP